MVAAPAALASAKEVTDFPERLMKRLEKSTLPIMRPIGGIRISFTNELTIRPKAAPRMIPTPMSRTLPRMANSLNSLSIFIPPLRELRRFDSLWKEYHILQVYPKSTYKGIFSRDPFSRRGILFPQRQECGAKPEEDHEEADEPAGSRNERQNGIEEEADQQPPRRMPSLPHPFQNRRAGPENDDNPRQVEADQIKGKEDERERNSNDCHQESDQDERGDDQQDHSPAERCHRVFPQRRDHRAAKSGEEEDQQEAEDQR